MSYGRAAGKTSSEELGQERGFMEPSSIFNRPGFGSVAFRNSIGAFNAMSIRDDVRIFHLNIELIK